MFERYNYQPSEDSVKIRAKLRIACVDPMNSPLDFCKTLEEALSNGDKFYEAARSLFGGMMQASYTLAQDGSYVGMQNAIITEPQSEEYCLQYYRLGHRVTVNHPDARVDIKKILKMRVNPETHVCADWLRQQPIFITMNSEEKQAKNFMALRFFYTPGNISSPLYAVYDAAINLLKDQQKNNLSVSITRAGKEIFQTIIQHQPQPSYISSNLTAVLANVPNLFVHLGTEPSRMAIADKFYHINTTLISPLQSLTLGQRVDVNHANMVHDGIVHYDLQNMIAEKSIYQMFDTFDETKLKALEFLIMQKHLTATHALEYFNYVLELGNTNLIAELSLGQTPHSLDAFNHHLSMIETCDKYNAPAITNHVLVGEFGHYLKNSLQPCITLANDFKHDGYHYHNMLPWNFHTKAHQFEDTLNADQTLLRATQIMSLLLAITMFYGMYRCAVKPAVRKAQRFFRPKQEPAALREIVIHEEETSVLVKKTTITKTKTTMTKETLITQPNILPKKFFSKKQKNAEFKKSIVALASPTKQR